MGFTIIHGAAGAALGQGLGAAASGVAAGMQQADEHKRTQAIVDATKQALVEHEFELNQAKQLDETAGQVAKYKLDELNLESSKLPGAVQPGEIGPETPGQSDMNARIQRAQVAAEQMSSPQAKLKFALDLQKDLHAEVTHKAIDSAFDKMHDSWVNILQTGGDAMKASAEPIMQLLDVAKAQAEFDPDAGARTAQAAVEAWTRLQVSHATQLEKQAKFEDAFNLIEGARKQMVPHSPGYDALGRISWGLQAGLLTAKQATQKYAAYNADMVEVEPGHFVDKETANYQLKLQEREDKLRQQGIENQLAYNKAAVDAGGKRGKMNGAPSEGNVLSLAKQNAGINPDTGEPNPVTAAGIQEARDILGGGGGAQKPRSWDSLGPKRRQHVATLLQNGDIAAASKIVDINELKAAVEQANKSIVLPPPPAGEQAAAPETPKQPASELPFNDWAKQNYGDNTGRSEASLKQEYETLRSKGKMKDERVGSFEAWRSATYPDWQKYKPEFLKQEYEAAKKKRGAKDESKFDEYLFKGG